MFFKSFLKVKYVYFFLGVYLNEKKKERKYGIDEFTLKIVWVSFSIEVLLEKFF